MVNTFLVCSNFSKSASQLDRSRLGKQRVEAYQILNIIENLYVIRFVSGISQLNKTLKEHISDLVSWYKKHKYHIVISFKPKKDKFVIKHFCRIKYPKHTDIPLHHNQRAIKLGFANHPAVRLWYGYRNALKLYINTHIAEWISRGYTNTMEIYYIPNIIKKPSWCYDNKFHKNHKSSLLKKEIERNEPKWYQNKPDFIQSGEFIDYIWPR